MEERFDKITFRILEEKDLCVIWDWLQKDHVSEWYHSEPTFELQKRKLLENINGIKPTKAFVVQFDVTAIGYIQFYSIDGYPEYQKEIGCYDDACGIDMFIGEKDYCYKGIGSLMIMKFLSEIAFPQSKNTICIVGPDPENLSAIKAYSKVGFEYMKTVSTLEGKEYLMKISKNTVGEKINLILT